MDDEGTRGAIAPPPPTAAATTVEIVVCHASACRLAGSSGALLEIEELVRDIEPASCASKSIPVEPTGCLGHCGFGPNVLVVWDAGLDGARERLISEVTGPEVAAEVVHCASGVRPDLLGDPARIQRLHIARTARLVEEAKRLFRWNAALRGLAEMEARLRQRDRENELTAQRSTEQAREQREKMRERKKPKKDKKEMEKERVDDKGPDAPQDASEPRPEKPKEVKSHLRRDPLLNNLFDQADLLERGCSLSKALELVQALLLNHPDDPDLILRHGRLLRKLGRFPEARVVLGPLTEGDMSNRNTRNAASSARAELARIADEEEEGREDQRKQDGDKGGGDAGMGQGGERADASESKLSASAQEVQAKEQRPEMPPRTRKSLCPAGYTSWRLERVTPVSPWTALFHLKHDAAPGIERGRARQPWKKSWHVTLLATVGANSEGPLDYVERDYTPVSSTEEWDTEGKCTLLIKIYPDGQATQWMHKVLKVGDRVFLSEPLTTLRIPALVTETSSDLRQKPVSVVLMCGGTGVAPILQILSEFRSISTPLWCFYSCRADDILSLRELRDFCASRPRDVQTRVVVCVTDQTPDVARAGRPFPEIRELAGDELRRAFEPVGLPSSPERKDGKLEGERQDGSVQVGSDAPLSDRMILQFGRINSADLVAVKEHLPFPPRMVISGPAGFNTYCADLAIASGLPRDKLTVLEA